MKHHSPVLEENIYVDDIHLFTSLYKTERSSTKPYLLILHGLRADTIRMYPIIHFMMEKYNVISFDMPGHSRSSDIEEFDNFNDYCADKLDKLIKVILNQEQKNKYQIQKEDIKELSLFGVSSGAITILKYLIDHDPKIRFPLIGLQAPIYSREYVSFKPHMKLFIPWFTKNLSKGNTFTKIMQRVINSDTSFKLYAYLWDSDVRNNPDILAFEKRNWRIMPMHLWGKSVVDFFEANFENLDIDFDKYADSYVLLYPHFDQYLNVEKSVEGFKKLVPSAKVKYYKLRKHAPRGEVLKNPEVAKAIKELVHTFLYE